MKRINNILKLSVCFLLFAAVMSCGKDAAEGPVGPAGQHGEKGDKGDQGAKGADGTLLRYGNEAPASTLGNENDFYIDVKNSNFYGPKTGNSWGTATSLKGAAGSTGATGATGAKGADGSQFLSGTAVPTTQGKVGDFYFHTTTATLYGPKTSTGWGAGVSLKGAKGDKGDKGDDGNANIITMGWTIVTKEYWKNLHGYSSGANRWLSFDRPGDKGLRVVEDVFIANGNNLSGAILVYANNGTGSRMLPFEDKLTASGHTATLEHRFLFRNNRIYIVVALRDGTWDIDYIMNIYLPSIQWKVVLIPEMVAKTHADALSELNLNNYDAVAKHFGLKQ